MLARLAAERKGAIRARVLSAEESLALVGMALPGYGTDHLLVELTQPAALAAVARTSLELPGWKTMANPGPALAGPVRESPPSSGSWIEAIGLLWSGVSGLGRLTLSAPVELIDRVVASPWDTLDRLRGHRVPDRWPPSPPRGQPSAGGQQAATPAWPPLAAELYGLQVRGTRATPSLVAAVFLALSTGTTGGEREWYGSHGPRGYLVLKRSAAATAARAQIDLDFGDRCWHLQEVARIRVPIAVRADQEIPLDRTPWIAAPRP